TWLLRFPLPVLRVVAGESDPTPAASTSATSDPLVPVAVMSLNWTLVNPPKPSNEKLSTWSRLYDTPTAHVPPGQGVPVNSAMPWVSGVRVSPSRVTSTVPPTWHSLVRPKIADARGAGPALPGSPAIQTGCWPGALVAVTWPACGSKLLQSAARSSPAHCESQSLQLGVSSAMPAHEHWMRFATHCRAICSRLLSTRVSQSWLRSSDVGTKSGGRSGLSAGFRLSGRQTLLFRLNDSPPPVQAHLHAYACRTLHVVSSIPASWAQPALCATMHSNAVERAARLAIPRMPDILRWFRCRSVCDGDGGSTRRRIAGGIGAAH